MTTYDTANGKFATQRNADEFYANFTSDTVHLRFSGFHKTGTFACGQRAKPNDDYAVQTNLDLWVVKGGLTQYLGVKPGSACSITVTRLDADSIQGTYTAKLYADATKFVQISGAFHATK